jgi:hypothetical protein
VNNNPPITTSKNPSGLLIRVLFGLTLSILGTGLSIACFLSRNFRNQLAHPRTVQVGSADGVSHHYVFTRRAIKSMSGRIERPDVGLCFDNARLGIKILASPIAVGLIVRALLEETATYEGNAVLVLWFFALTRYVLPFGRSNPMRDPPPEPYLTPDRSSTVSSRITREPETLELDPTWEPAHDRHSKMIMPRGSAGEKVKLW